MSVRGPVAECAECASEEEVCPQRGCFCWEGMSVEGECLQRSVFVESLSPKGVCVCGG